MARTIEMVRTDAAHLFLPIERENPYAAEARQEFLDTLSRVHNRLEVMGGTSEGKEERQESLDIPDLGPHAPELMETRDLIDELDRDLVRLLARLAGRWHKLAFSTTHPRVQANDASETIVATTPCC